jgi:hypothetical protein
MVSGDGVGLLDSSRWAGAKIAVNGRGCNEAGTGFRRQGIIAE